MLYEFCVARHERLNEVLRRLIGIITLNEDLFNFFGIEIANRPFYKIAFFMNKRRRAGFHGRVANFCPETG